MRVLTLTVAQQSSKCPSRGLPKSEADPQAGAARRQLERQLRITEQAGKVYISPRHCSPASHIRTRRIIALSMRRPMWWRHSTYTRHTYILRTVECRWHPASHTRTHSKLIQHRPWSTNIIRSTHCWKYPGYSYLAWLIVALKEASTRPCTDSGRGGPFLCIDSALDRVSSPSWAIMALL